MVTDYGLDATAAVLHETAISKGFYDSLNMSEFNSQAKQLAMIHSEVTEVLEALRKSQGQGKVVEEIADILIRVLDFYAALRNVHVVEDSLDTVLEEKASINRSRPRMHNVLG
jgi:NTP pyrophosphatase (non-canonical NTP hydrolase)